MRSRINWYLVAAGVILAAAAFMFFSGQARSQALGGKVSAMDRGV